MAQVETLEKAQPDTGALTVGEFASQASQKVQLDIDDAPFLMDFDETPLPAVQEASSTPAVVDEEARPKKFWQKRPFQIAIGGGTILLIVLAVALYFWLSQPPPVTITEIPPTVIVVPSAQKLAGTNDFIFPFEPFMVEHRETDTVRFLKATFTLVTKSDQVVAEAKSKLLILRDAIFYYLRNKTHEYLIDPDNALTIKQDLLDIVNGYLVKGKAEDVLLENYILQ